MYYDDDSTQPGSGTLERMTHQIKDVVDEVYEMLQAKSNDISKADRNLGREIERWIPSYTLLVVGSLVFLHMLFEIKWWKSLV